MVKLVGRIWIASSGVLWRRHSDRCGTLHKKHKSINVKDKLEQPVIKGWRERAGTVAAHASSCAVFLWDSSGSSSVDLTESWDTQRSGQTVQIISGLACGGVSKECNIWIGGPTKGVLLNVDRQYPLKTWLEQQKWRKFEFSLPARLVDLRHCSPALWQGRTLFLFSLFSGSLIGTDVYTTSVPGSLACRHQTVRLLSLHMRRSQFLMLQ